MRSKARNTPQATPAANTPQDTPAATPAANTPQDTPQATPAHTVPNQVRHLNAYLPARKTLAVVPAAQVSYAWLAYAQAHGVQATLAANVLAHLVAFAQTLPPAFWPLNAKPANAAVVQALLAAAVAAVQAAQAATDTPQATPAGNTPQA